jgi:hypothetical protein
MITQRTNRLLAAAMLAIATIAMAGAAGPLAAAPLTRPADVTAGSAFWQRWGDGRAELAGYDLTFPRYGSLRAGMAVTIFVTETFSNTLRVKSDPGQHPKTDEYPVMKLNLVQDFPTGIYDYNLMTSVFTALTPVNGRSSGAPTKVSFSSQEWCGNVYSQALFDAKAVRVDLHSYFDGEADRHESMPAPPDGGSEDALLLWARGFASPVLAPGEAREVQLLRSLEWSRLLHRPLGWEKATLKREAQPKKITVPAGTFDTDVLTAALAGGRTWTFYVEREEPHRVIQWESSDGEKAKLLASDRLEYWKLHDPGMQSALAKLGLKPRAARMP